MRRSALHSDPMNTGVGVEQPSSKTQSHGPAIAVPRKGGHGAPDYSASTRSVRNLCARRRGARHGDAGRLRDPVQSGPRGGLTGPDTWTPPCCTKALARDPDRLDAIVQLGIVRYKLGALDGAIELLERARPRAPAEPTVRLFLALAYLRKNKLALADEQPHDVRRPQARSEGRGAGRAHDRHDPRGAALGATRAFAAASLENAAELAAEVDAWRALESERWYFWGPYPYPPAPFPGCGYVWRGGWLRCY